uniref:Metalloendopeptidase n=1 Tax=Kryptolebias marmoratus TaxID=37003 RepID=A0A3Q3AYK2_KRYMA
EGNSVIQFLNFCMSLFNVLLKFSPRLTMEIKGHIFLMVNLAVSSALPFIPTVSIFIHAQQEINLLQFIVRALDTFRVKSCIDFKVWDTEEYYLNIVKLIGCWSYVGQVFANGQNLSIGAGCESHGVVEHEILHALGFYHEQSRYDRDDYVDIVFNNIKTGLTLSFLLFVFKCLNNLSSTHGTPYDYFSVMHYNKDAFTNGNGSTIITIDPKYQDVIGQRLDMSPLDVQELNLLYKCGKR